MVVALGGSWTKRGRIIDDIADRGVRLNTGAVDCSPHIAAMISMYGYARFGVGTYLVDPAGAGVISNAEVIGAGIGLTTIKAKPGVTGSPLTFGDNSRLADFTIEGNGREANTRGIRGAIAGAENVVLQRLRITEFAIGWLDSGVVKNVRLENLEFDDNAIVARTNQPSEGLVFLSPVVTGAGSGSGDAGIELQASPNGGLISGGNFKGLGSAIGSSSGRYFTIVGNRFEDVTTPFVPGGYRNELGVNHVVGGAFDGSLAIANSQNTHLGRFHYTSIPTTGVWLLGDLIVNRSLGALPGTPWGWEVRTSGDFAHVAFPSDPNIVPLYRASGYLEGSFSWTPGAITGGSSVTQAFTVTGANAGDIVTWGFSQNLPNGATLNVQAIGGASNNIEATIFADANATIANGTLKVRVHQ